MKPKHISVFFSALLCSTIGHEYLKVHELQKSHHERSQLISSRNARTNQQQCSYVCPVPSPSPECNNLGGFLKLVFIKETKVFALNNSTSEVAIIFQIGEPIALLGNQKTGDLVVINIEKQTIVHYPPSSNDNAWNKSQLTLLEYLQNLGPLTNVNNWKNGKTFKFKSIPKEVKNVIISIVQHLDIEISERVKINPDSVVSLISVLTNGLLESSEVVQLLFMRLESSVTVILGGVTKLVNLIVGLKSMEKQLQGGLQTIIRNDTNLAPVLGENSGFNSLIDLLIQASAQVDLTKVLGDSLQSPEAILGLAVGLDGGIYIGISGITAVIYNIQLYAAKKITLEALIDTIIQVQAWNGHLKLTKETWNYALYWYFVLAETQTTQFNTGSSWSTLNKFFQDIKNEKLIINGINVSAIINVLISTSGNTSLSNVVKILLYLKPVVSMSKIVATLYCRMIYFVISGQGILFIHTLLPQITININYSSTTSILQQIFSRVNAFQIFSYILKLDIGGAISQISVLGPILKALDKDIKVAGESGKVTVTSSLKTTGDVFNNLKNWILYGLGKGGKAPADSSISGLSALGGGVSVSSKTTWVGHGSHKESTASWSLFR